MEIEAPNLMYIFLIQLGGRHVAVGCEVLAGLLESTTY